MQHFWSQVYHLSALLPPQPLLSLLQDPWSSQPSNAETLKSSLLFLPCCPTLAFWSLAKFQQQCPLPGFLWACLQVLQSILNIYRDFFISTQSQTFKIPCKSHITDHQIKPYPFFTPCISPSRIAVIPGRGCPVFLSLCLWSCCSHPLGHSLLFPSRPTQKPHLSWSAPDLPTDGDLSLRWTTVALYLYLSHGTYHILPCIIVIVHLSYDFLDCKLAKGRDRVLFICVHHSTRGGA